MGVVGFLFTSVMNHQIDFDRLYMANFHSAWDFQVRGKCSEADLKFHNRHWGS